MQKEYELNRKIYISLWTNYNYNAFDLATDALVFTFHYELIITVRECF